MFWNTCITILILWLYTKNDKKIVILQNDKKNKLNSFQLGLNLKNPLEKVNLLCKKKFTTTNGNYVIHYLLYNIAFIYNIYMYTRNVERIFLHSLIWSTFMCTYILLCKQKIHHNFSKKSISKHKIFQKSISKHKIFIHSYII